MMNGGNAFVATLLGLAWLKFKDTDTFISTGEPPEPTERKPFVPVEPPTYDPGLDPENGNGLNENGKEPVEVEPGGPTVPGPAYVETITVGGRTACPIGYTMDFIGGSYPICHRNDLHVEGD